MSKNWLFCPISVQNISDWKFDLLLGDFGFRQNVDQGPLALFWYKNFDIKLSILWVILAFPETFFLHVYFCFEIEKLGNRSILFRALFKFIYGPVAPVAACLPQSILWLTFRHVSAVILKCKSSKIKWFYKVLENSFVYPEFAIILQKFLSMSLNL